MRHQSDDDTTAVAERRDPPARQEEPNERTEYKGILINTSRKGDYGFIGLKSITRLDGSTSRDHRLRDDLIVHVKKNRDLGDPLPQREVWLRFYIVAAKSREGIEAFGATLLKR